MGIGVGLRELTFELSLEGPTGINRMIESYSLQVYNVVCQQQSLGLTLFSSLKRQQNVLHNFTRIQQEV